MRSNMIHRFSEVVAPRVQRSVFNRDHSHKTTFDADYLIPIYVDEALPGDTFNVIITALARLATPIKPIMDNLHMDIFFFAVPNRLLWVNWQRMMGERDPDPDSSIDYSVPQVVAPAVTGFVAGSIFDYFGVPTEIANLSVNALFSRAYNKIWNDWFRDENLQDSGVVDTDAGPDDPADYVLIKRCKKHDYFTSCLPFPQKSTDPVYLPLGEKAPVTGIGKGNQSYSDDDVNVYETGATALKVYANGQYAISDANANNYYYVEEDPDNAGYPNIYADLSSAVSATINEWREALQTQALLELDARGGSRYAEIIMSHFGVRDPQHAVLQRSEFLGGNSEAVNISPVPQTSVSAATPQGNLAGFGTAICRAGFTKSFTEHCTIIGLVNVRADITYQEGLPKMFSRLTRYDYYWPSFANLGEQAVLKREIYCDGSATDDDVFGYQERYAEYRYYPSKITGLFRSNHATPLHVWHLSEIFGAVPSLDDSFIPSNTPVDRVIVTPTEPHFLFDSFISNKTVRPMPVYATPASLTRF